MPFMRHSRTSSTHSLLASCMRATGLLLPTDTVSGVHSRSIATTPSFSMLARRSFRDLARGFGLHQVQLRERVATRQGRNMGLLACC